MFAITPANMARLQRLGIGNSFLFNHTFQLFNPPWEGNGSGISRTSRMPTDGNRPFALRINDMQQTLYETLTRHANFRDRFFMIRPRRKNNFTNIKCKIVIEPPSRILSWYLFWDEDKEKNYLELSNKDIGSIIDATGGRGAGFLGASLLSQTVIGGQTLASSFGAIVYLFYTAPPHVLRIPDQRTPSEPQNRFRLFQDFDPSTGGIRGCYLGIQVSREELQRYRQYRPQETTTDEPLIRYLVGLARDRFFGRDFAIAAYINTKNFFDVEVKQYQNLCANVRFHGKSTPTRLFPVGDSRRKVNFFSGSGVNFGIEDVEDVITYLFDRPPRETQEAQGRALSNLNDRMNRIMDFNISVTLTTLDPSLPLTPLPVPDHITFEDRYPL